MTFNYKNKLPQGQKKTLLIAGVTVGAALLLTFAFAAFGNGRSQSYNLAEYSETFAATEAETPYNVETFREAFLANCTITAKTTLSEAAAKAYCGCVLDRGAEVYGMKRFIEINQEVAKTYDLSSLKGLIEECVAKVTATPNETTIPATTYNEQDFTTSEPAPAQGTYTVDSEYYDMSSVHDLRVEN